MCRLPTCFCKRGRADLINVLQSISAFSTISVVACAPACCLLIEGGTDLIDHVVLPCHACSFFAHWQHPNKPLGMVWSQLSPICWSRKPQSQIDFFVCHINRWVSLSIGNFIFLWLEPDLSLSRKKFFWCSICVSHQPGLKNTLYTSLVFYYSQRPQNVVCFAHGSKNLKSCFTPA